MNTDLPIFAFKDEILDAIEQYYVTILVAETGAGKSTQVPQYLYEAEWKPVITEPRRLAASSLAARVAYEMRTPLGGNMVGYKTAHDYRCSRDTEVLFVTDGIAVMNEFFGEGQTHDILVIDEMHEWNLNQEMLAAMVKSMLKEGDFGHLSSVLIMSATLEAEKLSAYFDDAPIIRVPGRVFPVEDIQPRSKNIVDEISNCVSQGRNSLVFFPGKGEIQKAQKKLEEKKVPAIVLPLHGELSPEDQALVFKNYDQPKVVLSTNVAETSVTVDGIDAVIDSGKERRIETIRGVEGLVLRTISEMNSLQRKGRAGRTKPGIYIDMNTHPHRDKFPKAEIERRLLDHVVLVLARAGIDAEEYEFYHQPPLGKIQEAKLLLQRLGCLDEKMEITDIGKKVVQLPCAARFGRMIVEAQKHGVVDAVIDIVAILEQKGITLSKHKGEAVSHLWRGLAGGETESDALAQLQVFCEAHEIDRKKLSDHGINKKAYFRARQSSRLLRRSLKGKVEITKKFDREGILMSVAAGLLDQIFIRGLEMTQVDDQFAPRRKLGKESVVRFKGDQPLCVGIPFDLELEDKWGDKYTLCLLNMVTALPIERIKTLIPDRIKVEMEKDTLQYNHLDDKMTIDGKLYIDGFYRARFSVDARDHESAAELFRAWLVEGFTYGFQMNPYNSSASKDILDQVMETQKVIQSVMRAPERYSEVEPINIKKWLAEVIPGASRLRDIKDTRLLRFKDPRFASSVITYREKRWVDCSCGNEMRLSKQDNLDYQSGKLVEVRCNACESYGTLQKVADEPEEVVAPEDTSVIKSDTMAALMAKFNRK